MKRRSNVPIILAALVITGCSSSTPLRDMVGYVPPTSLPAQPKRTLVAEERKLVWTQLVDLLVSSAFEVDHVDEGKGLLVARYSGDPEPFIDCGSIVTHQNGTLGQIAGSAPSVELNYEFEDEPVVLDRALNLDSRIIIRLADQPQGTVIKTDTTYVVTKTVDVVDLSGAVREGSRETISFEAGNRGEFSKGTACQPNGTLDLAVLKSLPKIVGSDEIDRAQLSDDDIVPLDSLAQDDGIAAASPEAEEAEAIVEPWNEGEDPVDIAGRDLESIDSPTQDGDVITALPNAEAAETIVEPRDEDEDPIDVAGRDLEGIDAAATPLPWPNSTADDWILPDQGLPESARPQSDIAETEAAPSDVDQDLASLDTPNIDGSSPGSLATDSGSAPETAVLVPDGSVSDQTSSPDISTTTIVDDTTKKLLQSLDCSGEEWHFCDLVELTTPFRKRNIDQLLGLTVNTTESFTSQVVGRDLKLDILFPSFPSHLHIAYARRDGTIEHIMSSQDVWPADLAHQIAETGQTIPGPAGLAMIIAIASDRPLFASQPDVAEDAAAYLDQLKQRLAELETETPGGSVTASQLLIYVENGET